MNTTFKNKTLPRVLILDDELAYTDPISAGLNREGFEVYVVSESSRAISDAVKFRPDVIFLDLIWRIQRSDTIPQASQGDDLLPRLKQEPSLKDAKIIFVTGKYTQEEIDAYDGFYQGHRLIKKPEDVQELITFMRDEGLLR